ncbi:MAG: hypothetical protein AAGA93_21905 [Actinomycetota bacterium]
MISAVAAVAVGSTACARLPFIGDDARYLDAGERLIEGELAERIGLGALPATCEGSGLDAGQTFTCSAEPAGQPPIRFVATISDDGDGVDLMSTNLLLAEQVERIEAFAAALIAEDTGRSIGPNRFECADTSVVVDAGDALDCLVTDPADGVVHAVGVTIDDLATLSITVDVGDPIG